MSAATSAQVPGTAILAGGTVYAVAGCVAADRPTTWINPGQSGYFATPCYVLRSGRSALIVDTGLAVHWEAICPGLEDALANTPDRALIMTRREPDAIGNLPDIVRGFDLAAVYCGGVINPLDFFERVESISATMHIRVIANVDVTWVKPGGEVAVGDLVIEVLPTTLRVLPKNHFYERRSRTLFGSDTWGFVAQASPNGIEILREADERVSVIAITRHLLHRFDWLAGVDTAPMQEEVERLSSYQIDRICSSYGSIIEGRDQVATVLRNTITALKILSQQNRARRMDKLVRDKIALVAG